MSSFHFQIIITSKKKSHFEFLPSVSHFLPVFRRMTHIYMDAVGDRTTSGVDVNKKKK